MEKATKFNCGNLLTNAFIYTAHARFIRIGTETISHELAGTV